MTRIRPAAIGDLHGVMAVWAATEGLPQGLAPLPLFEYELETGRMMVADDEGTVVGFGATLERDGRLFLTDLFVRPDRQSGGLGRAILEALLEPWPDAPRYTSASSDPRAKRLYERMGMSPRFEIDYLHASQMPKLDQAHEVVVSGVDPDTARRHHRWTGSERAIDLSYWAGLGAQVATVFDTEPIGHGFIFPHTRWSPFGDRLVVGQVVASSEADAAALTQTVFAAAASMTDRADPVLALIPRLHPAHPTLLGAGMEVVDTDLFMASDGVPFDPLRRTVAPDIN